jgi:hypothetical protein
MTYVLMFSLLRLYPFASEDLSSMLLFSDYRGERRKLVAKFPIALAKDIEATFCYELKSR